MATGQWEPPSCQPQPHCPWQCPCLGTLGSTQSPGLFLAPAPGWGVTGTHRMRISFHSSSKLPICFPVFLVSLGSPSPATST